MGECVAFGNKTSALWKKYSRTKKIEYRDELIVSYLHLVKWVVGRLGATFPSFIKNDDLYSSGVTGLIRAVERFDPSKKSKFESYAILLIKGAIIDELRKLDWIPRSVHQKASQISSAQCELQQKLGRDPTDEEFAEHLGITTENFFELLARIRPIILIPLSAKIFDDEESAPLVEKIPDQNVQTSSEIVHKKEFGKILERAISKLPEQEKKVLKLYYYDELMLKEIGKILGVSESRVSQIHTKALLKLRGQLGSYR
ncbi:MAG: FliA/WhiG family RNA polymerase sigma factor [Chlamydiia bacterium]|nr:FliA/WhiG family RNA polymerase sigma factor [Chlamydiia bacterium]